MTTTEITQEIKDPEIEAQEFEAILRDMGKAIGEKNERLSKTGISFSEFKKEFIKKMNKNNELHYLTEAH